MYNDSLGGFALSYERSGDCTSGYIYNIGFGLVEHIPLLFCVESLLKNYNVDLSC